MSEWNSIENRLRTWVPRQPSPELRARIFARKAVSTKPGGAGTPSLAHLGDFTRWLVPAVGCFLLVTATLSNRYAGRDSFGGAGTNYLLARSQNDASEMLFPRHPDHSDINNIPARRLEWRFSTGSAAPVPAALIASFTNKLNTNE